MDEKYFLLSALFFSPPSEPFFAPSKKKRKKERKEERKTVHFRSPEGKHEGEYREREREVKMRSN